MAKKGIYPAPVYCAHFADGSVIRMSFWSEYGKPINYESGARTCALAAWENPALALHDGWRMPPKLRDEKPKWSDFKNDAEATAARNAWGARVEAERAARVNAAPPVDIWAPRKPAGWLGGDCYGSNRIVDGYVFRRSQDGEDMDLIGRDPRMEGESRYECAPMPELRAKAKRGPTAADLKALLVRVLANEEAALAEARRLVA